MGGLIFLANRVEKRYRPNSAQRNRAELALGCAILALPGLPAILVFGWFGSLIVSNPLDPASLVIEAIVAFNLAMLLLFGIAKWRVGLSRNTECTRD
jgi:hypothetical protein